MPDPRIKRLLGPDRPELMCDECFERLDEFVDLELRGARAEEELPGMRPHLEGCPACREEYESLRELAALSNGTPGPRARLVRAGTSASALCVDMAARSVRCGEVPVRLTRREFDLLHHFDESRQLLEAAAGQRRRADGAFLLQDVIAVVVGPQAVHRRQVDLRQEPQPALVEAFQAGAQLAQDAAQRRRRPRRPSRRRRPTPARTSRAGSRG